jgi:hypothetical protein
MYIYTANLIITSLSLFVIGRRKNIAAYYKRQEKILKGFTEVDGFTELGTLPGSLTEV